MPGMRRHDSPPVRRGFQFSQFKALDDAHGVFEGYLAIFGTVDATRDIIEPGAFTKCLSDLKARQQARLGTPGARYLMPIFWEHDDAQSIGGFTDAYEDERGLYVKGELDLDIEMGQRAYSAMTKGYVPGMSIGYFAVRFNFDRQGVRHLLEVAVFEGSVTPIPAHPDAVVMQVKSATGKSDWPLASRTQAWDGGAAHKRIVQWATNSDGSVDTGKLKSVHFYSPEGDAAQNVSEYKLLFCDTLGGSVKAVPKAIFACAGAHGVDFTTEIPSEQKDAIKSRITAYYHRMAKEFGDTSIVSPFESSTDQQGKGAATHMPRNRRRQVAATRSQTPATTPQQQQQVKARTFEDVYTTDREAADLLEDLDDLWEALRESILSVLIEGANNTGDNTVLAQSLDQFGQAVTEWTQMAEMQDCWGDIADNVEEAQADMADYATWGVDAAVRPNYYYMAMNLTRLGAGTKAGRVISQTNAEAMQKALQQVEDGHKATTKALRAAMAGHKAAMGVLKSMQPGANDGDSTDDDGDEGSDNAGSGGNASSSSSGKGGKSLMSAAGNDGHAPGASSEGDTTQQQPQGLSADELAQMIRERLAASLAAGNKQSA